MTEPELRRWQDITPKEAAEQKLDLTVLASARPRLVEPGIRAAAVARVARSP